jgi:hypothetical protein
MCTSLGLVRSHSQLRIVCRETPTPSANRCRVSPRNSRQPKMVPPRVIAAR